jgi:hypothetical protein
VVELAGLVVGGILAREFERAGLKVKRKGKGELWEERLNE